MSWSRQHLSAAVLILLSLILLFTRLGLFSFKDYDEATYALVASEMVESGDLIYLTHQGKPWIDKPPLLFWMILPSVKLFGFTEFALRLPGALIGLATLLLTYAFARALKASRETALLAAAILLTTSQYVYSSRELRLDMPAAFGILLSVYGFYRGLEHPRWFLLMGFGVGATILFKGTVVVFVPILCLIVAFLFRQWQWFKQPLFWAGGLFGLVIALPWHIAIWQKFPDQFVSSYLARHSYTRYLNPILGARNTSPLYFFTLGLRIVEPWFSLFFVGLGWLLFKGRTVLGTEARKTLLSLGIGIASILLIFSFSQSKLFPYIDPIYPFLALFLALLFAMWQEQYPAQQKKIRVGIAVLLFVGLLNTVWQIAEVRAWPRRLGDGEYALARDERAVSDILNAQTASRKLNVLFHGAWDTIRFYTKDQAEPIEIQHMEDSIDPETFYLLVPNRILAAIDLSDAILERATRVYRGKTLTLYRVDKQKTE